MHRIRTAFEPRVARPVGGGDPAGGHSQLAEEQAANAGAGMSVPVRDRPGGKVHPITAHHLSGPNDRNHQLSWSPSLTTVQTRLSGRSARNSSLRP